MQKNEPGLVIHPFALEVKDALAMNHDFLESVFSLGNGYMGVRGYDSLKSAYLDLHNIMDNTQNEGIHMASLGATWQALIFGMAGLHIGKDGTPALKPNFPVGIRSLEATVQIKHEGYRLAIKGGMAKIERVEKPCDSAADAAQ